MTTERGNRPSPRLELDADAAPARVTTTAFEQALDVLLENALVHGEGTTRVSVHAGDRHAAVRVRDEGSHREGTGLGRGLARGLIEADGGRVRLVTPTPTTFEFLLPRDVDGS